MTASAGRVEGLLEVGDEVVADSMPTDSRTSDAGTSSGEPATDAWVMRPGAR